MSEVTIDSVLKSVTSDVLFHIIDTMTKNKHPTQEDGKALASWVYERIKSSVMESGV